MALSDSAGIGSALPSQVGVTSGYVLQTDGALASWVAASAASLPSQAAHSGEFLTTNGTVASWTAVDSTTLLPDQTGNSGKVLSTDGLGVLSWIDASALTLAAVGSTPNADGATLSGGALNLEPADATHPGVVNTTANQVLGTGKKVIDGAYLGSFYGQAGFGKGPNDDDYGAIVSDDGSVVTLQGTTSINFRTSGLSAQLNPTNLDLTGLGNGGSIKLKSPDGTTYTATIANGGTWNIA